jgi:hypothetical protein
VKVNRRFGGILPPSSRQKISQVGNQNEFSSKQNDIFSETSVDFHRLQGVIYQKIYVSVNIVARTSNPNKIIKFNPLLFYPNSQLLELITEVPQSMK